MTELTVKCALLLLLSGAALFFDLRTGQLSLARREFFLFSLEPGFRSSSFFCSFTWE